MKSIIDFIVNHWIVIIICCSVVFEMVASIVVISNTPKTKRFKALTECLEKVPSFIIEAEKLLVGADQKKMFVIKRCLNFIMSITGFSSEKVENLFLSTISQSIEDILSTPQKKGA